MHPSRHNKIAKLFSFADLAFPNKYTTRQSSQGHRNAYLEENHNVVNNIYVNVQNLHPERINLTLTFVETASIK